MILLLKCMAELLCSSLLESMLIPRQLQSEFAKTYGSLGIQWSFVWSHSCGSKKQIPQHQASPKFSCMVSPRGSSLVKYSSTESSCSITNMSINNYCYRKEAAVMAFPLSIFFALPGPVFQSRVEAALAVFLFTSLESLLGGPFKGSSAFLNMRGVMRTTEVLQL